MSFTSAVNRTLISGPEAATAILSSADISVKDLKCNLAQWRCWPSYRKKGQQWGPFPDWSLMRRSVLWHKSWSEEGQRKMKTPPSRYLLTAISTLTLGPSRREAPVTGDGVTLITTTETGADGEIYLGISLRVCTTPTMTTPPQKRLLDMEFDLIFLDPRFALCVDHAANVVPQWLWDVMKNGDTVCYEDHGCSDMIDEGLQAWADNADTQFHCWKLPVYVHKKSPTQADEWKTKEAAAYIWSAKTLPALVCPVGMFSRRFDVHTDTPRPRRVVRVSCTPYPHSYRR